MKDVLLQTRVPSTVANEVKRRAEDDGDSDAGWLRRLLIRETSESLNDEFLDLGGIFIRKSRVTAMDWVDPHGGSCAEGEKPYVLGVHLDDGSRWALESDSAAILLKEFGLPSENPYPNGKHGKRQRR